MSYIVFDKGLAHLISFKDNLSRNDFTPFITEHYQQSINELVSSIKETDKEKQKQNVYEANTGDYWNKYAAISGMLYLASNYDDIIAIYKAGPSQMIKNIVDGEAIIQMKNAN